MTLLARYNNVPMPNMRLNELEVDLVLEHIEEASARVEKHVKMGHRRDPLAPKTADNQPEMDHSEMDHGAMDHGEMDHGEMDHSAMDHSEPAAHGQR